MTSSNEYTIVRKSGIHKRGVFAKKDIAKGTFVVEYKGRKVTKAEGARIDAETSKKGYTYMFELNKKWDIDGNVSYNGAKYINHSCSPNCKYAYKRGHIWIVAKKKIKKWDELSYNYGFDFKNYQRHKCKCGSKNCVGYILDKSFWKKLKKSKSRK